MHGRLKVKTTAEQQEEKRKIREKKAAAFTAALNTIFANRGNVEANEENLTLTEEVLSRNPDVYTLWNIRKEIFECMLAKEESIDKLLKQELKLIQVCLHENPKSYGVWNQRRFVMKTMKVPDWKEELQLCNLFLKYDERNFHCWDYRRFVVRESNVPAAEELEFTTTKINENFSNYSSWHNRTKLLPDVYPDPKQHGKVLESELLKEFQLVQNAFFTDPNDQSAWFYQRWLLGRKLHKSTLLSLSVLRSSQTVIASFSHPVNKDLLGNHCIIGGCSTPLQWSDCDGDETHSSLIWKSNMEALLASDDDIKMEFEFKLPTDVLSPHLTLQKGSSHCSMCWTTNHESLKSNAKLFSDTHTEAKASVLENELESCKILLEEEPQNKWTMLTIVFLMRALDGIKFEKETEDLLQKLINVDTMRKGYYQELRSKYIIEDELQRIYSEQKSIEDVDLSGKGLTSFHHVQYFTTCKRLDVSNNQLKDFKFLSRLPCLVDKSL